MANASTPDSDEARVVRWVTDHGGAVRGYLLGVLRRHDLADDLSQEVFRRAWQARRRYQEQGAPRAYLLKIADRVACDWHRRGPRERTLDTADWAEVDRPDADQEPGWCLQQTEIQRELAAALDLLSETQRRVLLLRYYGEMSFEEIATALGCPLNTALSHCRRGLLALRKLLSEQPS